MSQRITYVVVFLLFLMLWPVATAGAEDADVKMIVLMEEFSVFPDKAEDFEELIKKFVELSVTYDFPYRFDFYMMEDTKFIAAWWVDGTAGIDNLYSAWDVMSKEWGEAESAKWMEEISATMSHWKTSVWIPRPDLSYTPEGQQDEYKYVVWGQLKIKVGHEKAMEEIFKEFIEVESKHKIPHGWNTAQGYVGVENPTLAFLEWSSTPGTFWMRSDELMANEELAKEMAPLSKKMLSHLRGFERAMGWYQKEMSYRPVEKKVEE